MLIESLVEPIVKSNRSSQLVALLNSNNKELNTNFESKQDNMGNGLEASDEKSIDSEKKINNNNIIESKEFNTACQSFQDKIFNGGKDLIKVLTASNDKSIDSESEARSENCQVVL
jgi:hypothetical protein